MNSRSLESMERATLIADIQHEPGTSPTIAFHNIEDCAEILGYHYVPHSVDERNAPDDQAYTKASAKGHKLAVKAADIFNNRETAASMRITGSGLVGGSPCEGHTRRTEGITWFEKTQFRFQPQGNNADSFKSTQYLHFSSPVAQVVPGLPAAKDHGQPALQDITVLSGMCLFSSKTLQANMPPGKACDMSKIECVPSTLYEIEYVARAAPAIADLTKLLSNGSNGSVNIRLDVPSFHYYQSVEERLREGSCTFSEALQWMAAVKNRHRQLSQVFCRYIDHEISRRPGTVPPCSIQVSPSGDLVCDLICRALADGVLPTLDPALCTLHARDPIWARFYDLVPEKEKPSDFRALGYLFFVYQVMRPALESTATAACKGCNLITNRTRLLISVDDRFERRIYSRAQKLLKKGRSLPQNPVACNLLEMYLSRRVFINQNRAGSNLYRDDPSPEVPALKLNTRLRANGECGTRDAQEHAIPLDPFDVVGALYGSSAADVLEDLFTEVVLRFEMAR